MPDNLDKLTTKLKQCKTVAQGGTRTELDYAAAYQAEVTAGNKPQIRKKYRGVK